jgi:hypothetical protein
MTTTPQVPESSPWARVLNWWNDARRHWSRLHELEHLDPTERDRIAADVGLSSSELMRLAAQPDGVPLLIEKRLAALNLAPEDIKILSPLILRDLQRTCALCEEKGRCADDMATDPLAHGWDSYCPNSGTLRSLMT